VFSPNEESLLWRAPEDSIIADNLDPQVLDALTAYEAQRWGAAQTSKTWRRESTFIAQSLHEWAKRHYQALRLQPDSSESPIAVRGFHSMFRVGSDGQLLTEAGVQFVQTPRISNTELGGLSPRAGTTVIFSGDGSARYVIPKPLALGPDGTPDPNDPRMKTMVEFVNACDTRDPHYAWAGEAYDPTGRMLRRFNFALVHQAIRRTISSDEQGPQDGG
jgi:hypothetical protein